MHINIFFSVLHGTDIVIPLISESTDIEDLRVASMFATHVRKYARNYANPVEYKRRMDIFRRNLDFIEQYNKKNTGVTCNLSILCPLTQSNPNKEICVFFNKFSGHESFWRFGLP